MNRGIPSTLQLSTTHNTPCLLPSPPGNLSSLDCVAEEWLFEQIVINGNVCFELGQFGEKRKVVLTEGIVALVARQ